MLTIQRKFMFSAAVFVGCAVAAYSLLSWLTGCSGAQNAAGARALTATAAECEAIARAAGREDIALACHTAETGSQILETALAMQVCAIPDAGGQ